MNNLEKKKKYIREMIKAAISIVLIVACTMGVLLVYTDIFVKEEVEAAVLKQGSTGTTVKTIQTKLKQWGYYTASVDGIYGSKTVAAVKYFQKQNKLVVDGIVGAKTAAAIGISLASTSSSTGSNDTYLLARCVHSEARGEPYTGQVAVAAIVLNRVKSSSFPNTISGVIYQPWAFTAVSDGQINLAPDDSSLRAAKDALNGWDPTNGCIYYYNPVTATNAWIRSREIRLTIGDHVFCV